MEIYATTEKQALQNCYDIIRKIGIDYIEMKIIIEGIDLNAICFQQDNHVHLLKNSVEYVTLFDCLVKKGMTRVEDIEFIIFATCQKIYEKIKNVEK